MGEARNFALPRSSVTINDTAAHVYKIDGGQCKAEVVTIPMGTNKLPIKSISTLKFEEMTAEFGMSMGQPMLDWLNLFLENKHARQTGFVSYADVDGKIRAYLDFRDALLTEFGLPASDASNKEHSKLTVKWRPEETVRRDGDSKDIQGNASMAQKAFLPSNFRISIGDLPLGRCKKIDAMSFKMKVQEDGVGQHRIAELVATTVEYPNLVLTIARVDAPKWEKWFDDFCIKGNNGSDKELSGLIEWLTPNTKEVVASLELKQIGIFELKTDAAEASKDAAANFQVSMYFEECKFAIIKK
jgi:hypothetical protein